MSEQYSTSIADSPSVDEIFTLLSNQRRRTALSVLADCDGTLSVTELASEIIAREPGSTIERSDEELSSVSLSLAHIHLPKLDAMGLVEYNSERNLVETTATFDRVEPFVSTVAAADSVEELPAVELE